MGCKMKTIQVSNVSISKCGCGVYEIQCGSRKLSLLATELQALQNALSDGIFQTKEHLGLLQGGIESGA